MPTIPQTVKARYRRAAGHVDRILKGETPAELPVQVPTKYDLAMKTAKALGIMIPPRCQPAPMELSSDGSCCGA
jgi:ABC-type uncharacterized transport system substrate-binding protein